MPAISPAPTRVVSLDALRGFTMFWIIGGGFAKAAGAFGDVPLARFLATQFEHVAWEGVHFEDLIFPTFVFVAGASLVFSLSRIVANAGRAAAAKHILVRTLILFVLGIIYAGGLSNGVDNVRWLGVLQRIALAYCGAGLLFIFLKPRGLLFALIALLGGYWALLTFVPVPDIGAGHFAERENLANYLDRIWLPGRRYNGDHDPEGILSTLPAIGTCLLGVFAGLRLKNPAPAQKKLLSFIVAGFALLAAGYAWDAAGFPIIKKIWTSSYVLVAGGWSALVFAFFYGVIDLCGWQRWSRPFVWIGMNPITLYFAAALIDFPKFASRFTGGDLQKYLNATVHSGMGDLVTTLVSMTFCVLLAGFLYRRGIFIRA